MKIGCALAKRVGQGEVGGCTTLADSACVVAVACRKALVNAGWTICLLSCRNGWRKCSLHYVATPFQAAFSQEERSLVGGP